MLWERFEEWNRLVPLVARPPDEGHEGRDSWPPSLTAMVRFLGREHEQARYDGEHDVQLASSLTD